MDPARLIPTPDILPAPWWLFYILLVVTFTLHLIIANVMLGGGIMALASEWLKRKGERDKGPRVHKEIAPKLPMTIALTVNLGIPPLLFLQILYGNFIYVSTVLMAVYWLSIFVLIILAYYGAYLYNLKYDRLAGSRIWVMGISVLMMLAVGFFFTNSLLIMTDPKVWPTYFDRPGGMLIHFGEPNLIPRYLHFVVSSVAMGGLAMGLLGWWRTRKGDSEGGATMTRGLRVYAGETLFQFVVGALYLGTLPNQVLTRAAFGNTAVMAVFVISIATTLCSILYSMSDKPWHTAVCAVATIFFMVLFRYAVQNAYLETYLSAVKPEIVLQLGPMGLFIAALIGGTAVVVYLLKLALRPGKGSTL
jgi:hypothetical protein